MAHTPGSWTLDYYGDREIDVYAGDVLVCAMRGGCTGPDDEEAATADAHLIAAAPELLAALKATLLPLTGWAYTPMETSKPDAGDTETVRLCRAAIAKAEGRTT